MLFPKNLYIMNKSLNYFRTAISKPFYAVSAYLRDAVVERLKIVYQLLMYYIGRPKNNWDIDIHWKK